MTTFQRETRIQIYEVLPGRQLQIYTNKLRGQCSCSQSATCFGFLKFHARVSGCPIQVPILDTSRVTVQGDGLRQVAVNRSSHFRVNTHLAGDADLQVRVTGECVRRERLPKLPIHVGGPFQALRCILRCRNRLVFVFQEVVLSVGGKSRVLQEFE